MSRNISHTLHTARNKKGQEACHLEQKAGERIGMRIAQHFFHIHRCLCRCSTRTGNVIKERHLSKETKRTYKRDKTNPFYSKTSSVTLKKGNFFFWQLK